jgi:hypothetical protein
VRARQYAKGRGESIVWTGDGGRPRAAPAHGFNAGRIDAKLVVGFKAREESGGQRLGGAELLTNPFGLRFRLTASGLPA